MLRCEWFHDDGSRWTKPDEAPKDARYRQVGLLYHFDCTEVHMPTVGYFEAKLEKTRTINGIAPAKFSQWVEGRRTQYLSTNMGAGDIAFQNWRKFKEAFAPELIGQAVEETTQALGRSVQSCIDPFGGSGTSALACQFLNVRSTTIEVNPFLADLIEAKLTTYDIDALISDFAEVVDSPFTKDLSHFLGAPATFVEPGVKGRYLFSEQAAMRISSFFSKIERLKNVRNRRLLRVLLSSVSLDLSNVIVSGKGRRYRKKWESQQASAEEVSTAFSNAVIRAIYDIQRHCNRPSNQYDLIRGDCRELIPVTSKYDMAVFSPPYPNSFDYTDVYNVELWVGGYLKNSEDNKKLRLATLRSHVQISRDYSGPELESKKLREVNDRLKGVTKQLWDPKIPDMVQAYFADMDKILTKLRGCIIDGGRVYMVVGDSRYAGINIPVSEILNDLALRQGFQTVSQEPFRSMRTSPQQGGRAELLETLITLSL